MKKTARPALALCPCGSGKTLPDCCGRYLSGQATAPTAEALMRSRYTAYTLGDAAYLRATWHHDTCPADLEFEAEPKPTWLGLEVRRHTQQDDAHATVEFVARYKIGGRAHRLHEISRFVRIAGHWLYLDGQID